MSLEICKALEQGNEQVIADVQRIAGVYEKEGWLPKTPQELTSRLLYGFQEIFFECNLD
jgi:NAD+ synthase (glutamine-hydrolysing)